jgi:indolepyruvate ferredoxin oxidoreductase alpha subunit
MMRKEGGTKVIIMRHMCQLVKSKRKIAREYTMRVDPVKCLADNCGCNRLCTRLFGCSGLIVDQQSGQAVIDEALCAGCGLCSTICPANAIIREAN